MKYSIFPIAAMSAVALLLSSCKDYVGNEKTHPLFVKAGTAKNAGEFQDAAKCYEEFLVICPKSPVTHLELAKLYGESLNDPLRAVYHYEKWLSLNPDGSADSEDIRVLAEKSRKDLFKKLYETYKDDPGLRTASAAGGDEEMAKMKTLLSQYADSNRDLKEKNTKMREMLLKYYPIIKQYRQTQSRSGNIAEVKTESAEPKTESLTNSVKDNPQTMSPKTGTSSQATLYKVQPGDTLIKISRKFYGNPKYIRLIADANPGAINKKMQVRAGQTLKIPVLPKR